MILKLEQLRDNASHLIIHLLREQLSRGTSQHEKYLQKVNPGMSTWLLTRYSQPSKFTNEYFFRASHSQTTTTTISDLYLTCLKILWNWNSPVTITQTCYSQMVTILHRLPVKNIYNYSQSPHKVHADALPQPCTTRVGAREWGPARKVSRVYREAPYSSRWYFIPQDIEAAVTCHSDNDRVVIVIYSGRLGEKRIS